MEEFNPFRADVPDAISGMDSNVSEYLAEQAALLRETHNKNQAGDSTFPWQLLTYLTPDAQYTLGSVGRFYHETYGLIQARYVRFESMIATSAIGAPVGLTPASDALWVATNDSSKSQSRLVLGMCFAGRVPVDGEHGWAVFSGVNLTPVEVDGDVTKNQMVTWTKSGLVGTEYGAPFATAIGLSESGLLSAGELFIDVLGGNSLPADLRPVLGRLDALETGLGLVPTREEVDGKITETYTRFQAELAIESEKLDGKVSMLERVILSVSDSGLKAEMQSILELTATYKDQTKAYADGVEYNVEAINAMTRSVESARDQTGVWVKSVTEMANKAEIDSESAAGSAAASFQYWQYAAAGANESGNWAEAAQQSAAAAEVSNQGSAASASASQGFAAQADSSRAAAQSSATLAAQYKQDAEGSASAASSSASAANNSAVSASGSASAASSSASQAANYNTYASAKATRNIVSRGTFDSSLKFDPWIGAVQVLSDASIGGAYVLQQTNRDALETITTDGNFQGRWFRISGNAAAFGSFPAMAGLQSLNPTNGISDYWQLQVRPANSGYGDFSIEVQITNPTSWIRPFVTSNGDWDVAGHGVNWRSLRIEDITESKLSAASATAASGSATNASASAASASSQATLAANFNTYAASKATGNMISRGRFDSSLKADPWVYDNATAPQVMMDTGSGNIWIMQQTQRNAYESILTPGNFLNRRFRVSGNAAAYLTARAVIGLQALRPDGVTTDYWVGEARANNTGYGDFSFEMVITNPTQWVRPFLIADGTGALGVSWTWFRIEDITDSYAAQTSANAANQSAVNANASASSASQSSTNSATYRDQASGYANNASGSANAAAGSASAASSSASAASGSASAASGSASSAQSYANLAAQFGGGGGNLVKNSSFPNQDRSQWSWGGNYATNWNFGVDFDNANWRPIGEHALYIQQTDNNSGVYGEYTTYMPCEVGKYYEGSLYTGLHRAPATLYVLPVDASGNWMVSQGASASIPAAYAGGPDLSSWGRPFVKIGPIPAGARQIVILARKSGTTSGNDSYLFLCRPQLKEVTATTQGPSVYSPSANWATVEQTSAAATDAWSRTRAYWQVNAAVPGQRAQLTVYADNGGAGVDIVGNVSISGNLVVDGSIWAGSKLIDGSINTQKVADNQITSPTVFYNGAQISAAANTWTKISEVTLTTIGKPVLLNTCAAVRMSNTGTATITACTLRILRNGVEIYSVPGLSQMTKTSGDPAGLAGSLSFLDTPGAGTWTYEVQVQPERVNNISQRFLSAVELKK